MKTLIKSPIMKIQLILLSMLFSTFTLMNSGCTPTTPSPGTPCDTTNSKFKHLFDSLALLPPYLVDTTYDSEIHEYSFTVSSAQTLCKIGYESQAGLTGPTIMELRDSTTNTTLFSMPCTFSTTTTSYVSVTSMPTLTPGKIYTIKRIIPNTSYSLFNQIIGRMLKSSTGSGGITFPFSYNGLTIVGSKFYQNAGYQQDFGIPYIDIVFQ